MGIGWGKNQEPLHAKSVKAPRLFKKQNGKKKAADSVVAVRSYLKSKEFLKGKQRCSVINGD